MARQMYFGNTQHAQWVPCPATGATRERERRVEELAFFNGGKWVDESAAGAYRYSFNFPLSDQSDYEGLSAFRRFRDGDWGTDFLRFVDPMAQDQNLFSANWAAPGLNEVGWKPIFDEDPTFSNTGTTGVSSYRYPARSAVYTITSAANAIPTKANSTFTILIPPTGRLWVRWAGAVTGTAVLRMALYNLDGTFNSNVTITPDADSAAPAFGGSGYSGATYSYAKFYFTRTSTAASTFTAASLMAQINYSTTAPVLTQHLPGQGHCGLKFTGESQIEEYVMTDRHLVGGSIEMVEVESWK